MSLSFLRNAWFVLLLIIDFDKRRISAAPLPGGAFLFVVDEIKQPFVGLIAGIRPGCWYGGIVLKSGKKGFAIYREGKVVEQYSVVGNWKTGTL